MSYKVLDDLSFHKDYEFNKVEIDIFVKKIRQFLLSSNVTYSIKSFSYTSIESIWFRFVDNFDKGYEFRLDAFYNTEDDEDNIEGTLFTYKGNVKLFSYYGTIDYLIEIIKKTYEENI